MDIVERIIEFWGNEPAAEHSARVIKQCEEKGIPTEEVYCIGSDHGTGEYRYVWFGKNPSETAKIFMANNQQNRLRRNDQN